MRNGGTAKTNTAQHLALGLSRANFKVLLIDLDSQLNLTDNVNADKEHKNIYDVLSKQCSIADATQHLKELDFIASSENLASFQISDFAKVYLKPYLDSVSNLYDFAIIDTSPSLDVLTLSSLKSCDKIVLPVQTDKKSISGIIQVANELKRMQVETSKILGILLTRVKANQNGTKLVKSYLDNVANMFNTRVFKTEIRETAQIRDAELNGVSIYDYAPNSNGSIDYFNFVKEFLERVNK